MPITLTVIRQPPGAAIGPVSVHPPGGTIGRAPANTLVLPDPQRVVSGHHARFDYDPSRGVWLVYDESTNGLYVNDASVALGRGAAATLTDGDRLRLGEYELAIAVVPEAGPVTRPASDDSLVALLGESSPSPPVPAPTPPPTGVNPLDPLWQPSPPPSESEPVEPILGAADGPRDPLALLSGAPARPVVGDGGFDDLFGSAHAAAPGHGITRDDHVPSLNEQFTPPGAIPDDWDPLAPVSPAPAASPTPAAPAPTAAAPPPPPAGGNAMDALLAELDAQFAGAPAPVPNLEPPAPSAPATARADDTDIPAPPPEPPAPIPVEPPPPPPPPAPPTAAAPPDASTPAHPAAGPDEFFDAFLEGLGDAELARAALAPAELGRQLGAALRESLDGLMDALRARGQVKNELRMAMTQLQAVENNPLKFSVDAAELLARWFVTPRRGFLGAAASVQSGFADLREHQLATLAGIQAGVAALLAEFDPALIDERAGAPARAGGVLGTLRAPRFRDQYAEYYRGLAGDDAERAQKVFSAAFARAYDAQVQRLGALRAPTGH